MTQTGIMITLPSVPVWYTTDVTDTVQTGLASGLEHTYRVWLLFFVTFCLTYVNLINCILQVWCSADGMKVCLYLHLCFLWLLFQYIVSIYIFLAIGLLPWSSLVYLSVSVHFLILISICSSEAPAKDPWCRAQTVYSSHTTGACWVPWNMPQFKFGSITGAIRNTPR